MITDEERRRQRRGRLINAVCGALVLASTVYALWQISYGGLESVDTVGVLGLPVAVVGLFLNFLVSRKRAEGNDTQLAQRLARHVADREGKTRRQLLGDDTQRINLHYQLEVALARVAQAPPAGRVFDDGAISLPDITAYYRSTCPARLVITGAAGAGKTVLALELLLALNKARDEQQDPVAVYVPLAQWDTHIPLRTLLIQHLTNSYAFPVKEATHLVDHGLVLPVLDGLDEMDPTWSDGTPRTSAPRALAALEQLNAYQDKAGLNPAPLILICRTTHYDALPHADILIDAARITIAPVDTPTAVAYLETRARDSQRWQPLLQHLTAHPTSHHAQLLSTPWRLCLTATVYHRTDNPADLLHHHTHADLDHHLLARYIPATITAIANPHHYTPEQIHHWLHHLTSITRTDVTLHRLWPLAGRIRVRITDAFLTALTALLPLPLAWTTTDPAFVAAFVAATAALAGFSTQLLHESTLSPARFDVRQLRTRRGLGELVSGPFLTLDTLLESLVVMPFALPLAFALGNESGHGVEVVFGLTTVIAGLLTTGLIRGLKAEPTEAVSPRVTIRNDVSFGLAFGLAGGLGSGLTAGFGLPGRLPEPLVALSAMSGLKVPDRTSEFFTKLSAASESALPVGLVTGLAFGLAAGLAASTARRYAVFLVCSRGRLPFRLGRFLDWACTAGLMRSSGPAYQFRHRELQEWLAAHPDPVVYPATHSRP